MSVTKGKLVSYFRNSKSIYDLSSKLHLLFVSIMLLHILIITPYRYLYFPKTITYINLAELSIYVLSIAAYFLDKKNLSIYISAYAIPILYSYLMFKYGFPILTLIWFLIAFLLIYLVLIRGTKVRLLYAAFCLAVFFLPGVFTEYDFPENLIKVIQILALISVPLLISSFLELQASKVSSLNMELAKKFNEKDELSKELFEKNRDMVTFSNIMSHDLKSPLRTIISFSQLIKKGKEPIGEKNSQYFSYIENSAHSMEALITELLTYTKIDQSKVSFERVDLNDVVSEIKQLYDHDIERSRIKLVYHSLPKILGDRVLLKTLFRNLISNGFKYQPKDKENHIPVVEISSILFDDSIVVSIADNGIGISDDYKEKLYQPFERYHNESEYKGTGLGLSICKKVLDKHGARIELARTSPKGSVFNLIFKNSVG